MYHHVCLSPASGFSFLNQSVLAPGQHLYLAAVLCHPDSTRIHHVVFVTHDGHFNEASLQKSNLVTLFC